MDEIIVHTLVVGDLAVNCYVVHDLRTNQAFVIDCPAPAEALKKYIKRHNLEVRFFILTHGHFDHIAGLDEFTAPIYVHRNDAVFLSSARHNGSAHFRQPLVIKRQPIILNETELSFENQPVNIIQTPGHTPGGISIYFKKWVFTGDALFSLSIGRTDLPLASHKVLISGIKKGLLILPDETIVYPGHGRESTIGREKKNNPFLT